MNDGNSSRSIRSVAIADHIWDTLEQMAQEMGCDRDSLINQALFMYARLNGYLAPGSLAAANELMRTPPPGKVLPEPPRSPTDPVVVRQTQFVDALKPAQHDSQPTELPAVAPFVNRDGVSEPPLASVYVAGNPAEPGTNLDHDPARIEVAERVLKTADQLENLLRSKEDQQNQSGPRPVGLAATIALSGNSGGKTLFIGRDNGDFGQVAKERFIIGRSKHCDLVIDSTKVSREHAVLVRENDEFFLEDLNSSNGTWFNEQRIKRRKIENGDEYFICTERIKCIIR